MGERKTKTPRRFHTYRGARRNAARAAGKLHTWRSSGAKHRPYRSESNLYRQIMLRGEDGIYRKYSGADYSPWKRRIRAATRALRKRFGMAA